MLMAGAVKAGTALLSSITAVLSMKAAGDKENLEDICEEIWCIVRCFGREMRQDCCVLRRQKRQSCHMLRC